MCELQYSADTITQHDSGMIGQRAGDSKCDRGWITAKTWINELFNGFHQIFQEIIRVYPNSSNMDTAWWVRVNSLNIVRRIFNKEKMSSSLFRSRLENLFIGRNKSKCWKSAYSISHFAQNYLFPFQGSGNEIRL